MKIKAHSFKSSRDAEPTQKISALRRWTLLLVSTLGLATAGVASAQTQVYTDPAKSWGGWMNVFELNDAYLWGSGWGAGDLRAAFSADVLTLRPCTNVSNPTDAYWTKPDGTGNKKMQANWYVDTTSLVGSNITFSGNVVDYTLSSNYTCQAFIKVFNGDYSTTLQQASVPLTTNNSFFTVNLTANAAGAAHVQYGFITYGLNAPWTNSPDSDGYITIRTNAARPLNALVNPGFESDYTGWTKYGSGAIETTAITYYNNNNPVGASNVLVYEGLKVGKVWGTFSGGANYSGVYQDIPTGGGSVWSATAKALTHHQDHIGVWDPDGTNQFWIEVTFRDAGDNILATYKSPIIDSLSPVDTWIDMQVTNDVLGGLTFASPAGTTKVRYQEVHLQPFGYAGGSVYSDQLVLNNLSPSDPNITTLPVSQTKLVGETVTFSVAATGATPLSYQWKTNGVNVPDGGNISGATTSTLTIANVQKSQAGVYTVDVTDTAGTLTASATLTVKTCEEAVNLVENSSFETGIYAPWATFNGGSLKTNDEFWAGINVTNYDGIYGSVVENGGEWNGAYQDIPASPGQIFTADGWFYEPSTYPLTEGNWVQLEVQFRNGGTVLEMYTSHLIRTNDPARPLDTWYNLQATNGVPAGFPQNSTVNSYYLKAPANTTLVRYQVTMHVEAGSGGILYDAMSLKPKLPVTLTTTTTGGNLIVAWPTQCSTSYQVVYKDNLTDAWTPIGSPIPGDGGTKTASFPTTLDRRFYSVQTQ